MIVAVGRRAPIDIATHVGGVFCSYGDNFPTAAPKDAEERDAHDAATGAAPCAAQGQGPTSYGLNRDYADAIERYRLELNAAAVRWYKLRGWDWLTPSTIDAKDYESRWVQNLDQFNKDWLDYYNSVSNKFASFATPEAAWNGLETFEIRARGLAKILSDFPKGAEATSGLDIRSGTPTGDGIGGSRACLHIDDFPNPFGGGSKPASGVPWGWIIFAGVLVGAGVLIHSLRSLP